MGGVFLRLSAPLFLRFRRVLQFVSAVNCELEILRLSFERLIVYTWYLLARENGQLCDGKSKHALILLRTLKAFACRFEHSNFRQRIAGRCTPGTRGAMAVCSASGGRPLSTSKCAFVLGETAKGCLCRCGPASPLLFSHPLTAHCAEGIMLAAMNFLCLRTARLYEKHWKDVVLFYLRP